jgi:hypothetical protein
MPDQHGIQTIGYDVLAWAEELLAQPDGVSAGEPWRWTHTQARIVAWWYAVDESGQWLYRRGQIVLPKGSGKSPLAAALCCCELAGPVVFDGFDADGEAVGKPHPSPLVQLAAVNHEQTQNTYALVMPMLREGDAAEAIPGLDVGFTRIRTLNGLLKPITANAKSKEGARSTAAVLDEALSLDTLLPTPEGWVKMGEVQAGDRLIGGDGQPVRVTKTTDVMVDRDCYEVVFADGSSIVASAGHLWVARRCKSRDQYSVVTTEQMANGARWKIPAAQPVELPPRDLPIDPYLLGVWLGDGYRGQSYICGGQDDLEEIAHVLRRRGISVGTPAWMRTGYRVHVGKDTSRCPYGHDGPWVYHDRGHGKVGRRCHQCLAGKQSGEPTNVPLVTKLSKLGILYDKNVPTVYLRASATQRLALLQGLMDTDGSITSDGYAVYVTTDKNLADSVTELARSLGYTTTCRVRQDTRNESYKVCYKVGFTPCAEWNPFQLSRKRARVRLTRSAKIDGQQIASVTRVGTVPVRCVAVDSDDRLFLAGQWHVTHNTHEWLERDGGHRLASVIRRNLGKMNGRSIECTNAWQPGTESIAELTSLFADKVAEQRSGGKQQVRDEGILRFHPKVVVPNLGDDAVLRAALEQLYRDAPWVNIDRIISEVLDPGTHPSETRRFYLNEVVTADDALVAAHEWDACYLDDVLESSDEITLGFDGSKNNDATVLVAMRVRDRFATVIGAMEKPYDAPNDWEVDREFFDGLVANCFAQYRVVGFFSDVAHFESYVDKWHVEYASGLVVHATPKNYVGWDMRGRLQVNTRATEALVDSIRDGKVHHDGGSLLRRHVLNAKRRPNAYGTSFGKATRDSPLKVDGFAALQLAFMAASEYLGGQVKVRQRTGRVWGIPGQR